MPIHWIVAVFEVKVVEFAVTDAVALSIPTAVLEYEKVVNTAGSDPCYALGVEAFLDLDQPPPEPAAVLPLDPRRGRSPLVAPTRNVVEGTLTFEPQRPSHLARYNT